MAPLPLNTWSDAAITGRILSSRQNIGENDHLVFGDWRQEATQEQLVVESWGEGFMFGALLIMAFITIANMRRHVLLHKLILLELLLAMSHGTFCFFNFKGYGWYLSSTAALLYCSYFTHNVVAWMKIAPFFVGRSPSFAPKTGKWVRIIYLGTLTLTIGPLIFEIFNNFRFYNNISRLYYDVRPYEPLFRDPWWVFSDIVFIHVIRKVYNLRVVKLVKKSPRFGILLLAIALAIIFTIMDILASTIPALIGTDGINPYWKIALVFKCLTDNIMLDDFKSVLQRLGALKLDGEDSGNRTTSGLNALNLEPDEKAGNTNDNDDAERRQSSQSQIERWKTRMHRDRANRMSFSGRLLDEGETLDNDGYTRNMNDPTINRTQSQLGKVGVKIKRLPRLPAMLNSRKREEQKQREWEAEADAELEKHVDAADVGDTSQRDFALENELRPAKSKTSDEKSSIESPSGISPLNIPGGPRGDIAVDWPSAISPLNLPDGPQEIGLLDDMPLQKERTRDRPLSIIQESDTPRHSTQIQDKTRLFSQIEDKPRLPSLTQDKPRDLAAELDKLQAEARRKDKSPSPRRKSNKQDWEDMDFITALTDPDVEGQAPEER